LTEPCSLTRGTRAEMVERLAAREIDEAGFAVWVERQIADG
jgi:hypothetical protein